MVEDDVAQALERCEEGIPSYCFLHACGEDLYGVKNWARQPNGERGKVVEVGNIAEVDVQRADDQCDAQTRENQREERNGQEQRMGPIAREEDGGYHKRDAAAYEELKSCGDDVGDRERFKRYFHLGREHPVGDDAREGGLRGRSEKIHHDQAGEKGRDVCLEGMPIVRRKRRAENQRVRGAHRGRVEQRPQDAERGTAIAQCEVAARQFNDDVDERARCSMRRLGAPGDGDALLQRFNDVQGSYVASFESGAELHSRSSPWDYWC